MENRGKLIVLSGPSGVGKGTVIEALMEDYQDIAYSISATTRKPRSSEKDGVDYFFLSEAEFQQLVEEDEFIEWAQVHGNYYGTPKSYVEETLNAGQDVILEIDIQGAVQVKEKCEQNVCVEGIFIFLAPPSLAELENRIRERDADSEAEMELRMDNATQEMKMAEEYDYIVVNDQVEQAVEKIKAIIIAERCKVD
ncbi:guanylate kinase [Fuchsiella alkaliacetigena]|uniref:guanylate kinase n=1 Tax=Fuchsiella alkaliacetigena TaxID=957042 RepID=UPI00200A0BC1|nr:guanylate kinase [Fuchsiella alkaliacetigena]MCK8824233.1 guanylate kinase [Fuchsiella alkaliacetigena]